MANIGYRAGKFVARRKVFRRVPLLWAFAVAEALTTTHRHFAGVDPRARRRAGELVGQMDLWQLSKDLAAVASPIGMPGHRKRRR